MKVLARRFLPETWQLGRWVPLYLDTLARQYTKDRVIAGPFRGLVLPGESYASVYTPKLVGCYEKEVQFCIDEIIAWNPQILVDVGAAEGYYALGFAQRLSPQSRVVAFEAEPKGRKLLEETATLNCIGAQLEIKGYCTPETLKTAINSSSTGIAIVMDCEGGEIELLDPVRISQLRQCMLLVETHEFKIPGCVDMLIHRFSSSHEITKIEQSARHSSDYPFKSWLTPFLPEIYKMFAVYEHRPPANGWLFCKPRGD